MKKLNLFCVATIFVIVLNMIFGSIYVCFGEDELVETPDIDVVDPEQQIEDQIRDEEGYSQNIESGNIETEKEILSGLNSYEHLSKDFKADTAYVIFGDDIVSHNCTFMDGVQMGITDSSNEFYNEKTAELNIDGRKFYKANYVNFDVDESFYDKGDSELLVSVAYYDYGPAEGKFRFEYIGTDGTQKTITLIKSGKVQDWFVQTIYINDADLDATFASGANVRLGNNAYNLFKRLEIVNLSKLRREHKATSPACLATNKKVTLGQMGIIDTKSDIYADANLYKKCTMSDVAKIFSAITGTKKNVDGNKPVSGRELFKMCFEVAGIEYEDDSLLETAYSSGIAESKDLVFDIDSNVTYYNLFSVIYNTLFYENDNGVSPVSRMIDRSFFSDEAASRILDERFLTQWYKKPRKCPSKIINDNNTGTIYRYMNIFGNPTWRTYVTMQSWTKDGKSFICGLGTGEMFLYNTETEMLIYLDEVLTSMERIHAVMGTDDCVYYFQNNYGDYSIWKIDTKTLIKEKLGDAPKGVVITSPSLSNDCNVVGADCSDTLGNYSKPGEAMGCIYDIKNKEWKFFTHTFDYSNLLTHAQVNPQYTNLVSFAHEIGPGYTAPEILDRIWLYDFDTDKANVMFKQGVHPTNNKVMQGATHEVWSNNGEYMYFVNYDISNYDITQKNVGRSPSIVRYNIDGSHRKYYFNTKALSRYYNHLYPSGDDKFIVADTMVRGNIITLINTATNEVFPIAEFVWQGKTAHPYHAHPVVARDKYVVNWAGMDRGVLGIMWIDFTDIANQSAKGGKVELNDTVSTVSYERLDCEISDTKKGNRDCYFIKNGNRMYLDVSESIADCIDGKIKLSFEYYDNSIQPLIITYTSGVKQDNDHLNVENAEIRIKRKGTNKWKNAEIIIESGNFEDIGNYDSDMNIRGLCSASYIRNIAVEKID